MSIYESNNNNSELEEVQLNLSSSNSPTTTTSGGGNEFISQMEQVFKAIDTEETGNITLLQLRKEIESLLDGGDIDNEDENPMISKMFNYLKIVHSRQRLNSSIGGGSSGLSMSMDMIDDDSDINIDFHSFLRTMSNFTEGMDPIESRKQRLDRLKLPKFKIQMDLLKRYNITPRSSPLLQSPPSTTPNSSTSTPGRSPSKNKFGRLFSVKPVIEFDQFNDLVTKLNYGKEIPKSKLLLFINDLPKDQDDCIDASTFLSRYAGLNHPMSPKLTFDSTSINNSFTGEDIELQSSISSPYSSGSGSISSGNLKSNNSQIIEQLADLENENQNYLNEIQSLEKFKHNVENTLKKKDQEIERLKRDARFVDGMRDSNKDLTVQNLNLKNQIQKLANNEEMLRSTLDEDKDKLRQLNEATILKELEIKKLKLLLKTQQNINNKLSMMVTFSNEVNNSGTGDDSKSTIGNEFKDKTFTIRRIKPTLDKAKQILTKQKSDFFTNYNIQNNNNNNNYTSSGSMGSSLNTSLTTSPLSLSQQQIETQSLESEFHDLQQQQNTSSDHDEFNQLKDQLNVSDISLPTQYDDNNNNSGGGDESISESTSMNNLSNILLSPIKSTPNESSTTTTTTITTTTKNNLSPNNTINSKSLTSSYTKETSSPSLKLNNVISQNLTSSYNISGPTIASNSTSPNNINSSNNNNNNNNNTLSPFTLQSNNPMISNPNYGSLKRLKKQDLLLLHSNELKEHNENTESLINQYTQEIEDYQRKNNQENQRLSLLLQEERQASKLLEKQLAYQLDRNREMITGKETSTTYWNNFFNLITNFLPSNLLCNVSSTS